jgi:TctA family transporter
VPVAIVADTSCRVRVCAEPDATGFCEKGRASRSLTVAKYGAMTGGMVSNVGYDDAQHHVVNVSQRR